MRTARILFPLLAAAAFLGAQTPKAAAPAAPKAQTKKGRVSRTISPQAIADDLNARLCKAMEAGDAEVMAGICTADAELHLTAKDVRKGRKDVKAYAEGAFKATPVKSAKVVSTGAHRTGSTITDAGTFTIVLDDHRSSVTMGGRYTQLLWRGKDGQWRLHRAYPFMDAPAK